MPLLEQGIEILKRHEQQRAGIKAHFTRPLLDIAKDL
jgi:hypothetical protein